VKLAGLDSDLDFLALTYSPLNTDFTVEEPSVVQDNFRQIKAAANRRAILFQEAGYPTSPATHSSGERQADFYRFVFAELIRDPVAFSAVNVMTLADLADADAQSYAGSYECVNAQPFNFKDVYKSSGFSTGTARQEWLGGF
jgi:hypothetical protein